VVNRSQASAIREYFTSRESAGDVPTGR
jgi:hypothetical protein